MKTNMFIDADYGHKPKLGQIVCGDVFMNEKIKNENRLVAVLSDGLGSGIKANILAKMTASMALNFTVNNQPLERSAISIKQTLPICEVRKIAFATFTIVDTEFDGFTRIIEYGNPQFVVFRRNQLLALKTVVNAENELSVSEFNAEIEDRIILFSDGVSQSGIGRKDMPFGWGNCEMIKYIQNKLTHNPHISAKDLQKTIISRASLNDNLKPQDDTSCGVLYFRTPRQLILCSGPPYDKNKDAQMVEMVSNFPGHKVISGGTTAQIFARELKRPVEVDLSNVSPELPPIATIEGIDLVTEGILTLGKSAEILKNKEHNGVSSNNPAMLLSETFLNHDKITFLIGTRINEAHQDPKMPVELEIRRNVIKKIAYLLEKKYLKEVEIKYI
ncbi:MAG: SpoIIE family protein phosphatase [Bacteroidales bacterium]|nr:SpoIIE family protein phosphatase [Bacteroidales bacterium]